MQVIITINPLPPGSGLGPNFTLTADVGVVVPNIATLAELLAGKLVTIDPNATTIYVTSMGVCTTVIELPVPTTTTTTSTTSTTTSTTSTSTTTSTTTTSTTSTTTTSTTTTTTAFPEICFGFEVETVGGSGSVYYELPSSGNIPPVNGKPAYDFSGLFGYAASIYFDGSKWVYFNSNLGGILQTLSSTNNYPISDGITSPIWTPDCNGCSFTGFINTSVFGSCPTTTTTIEPTTTTTSTTVQPCQCYTLWSSDETGFTYIDCNGDTQLIGAIAIMPPVNVCALEEPIPDNEFGIITLNGTCSLVEGVFECVTTTTLEPTTTSTTTTTSTSTTTTTTIEPTTTTTSTSTSTTTTTTIICNCYSIFNPAGFSDTPIGVDCDGIAFPSIPGGQTLNVCSASTPGVAPGSLLEVTLIGNCSECPTTTTTTTSEPTPICECHILFNETAETLSFNYTACNGSILTSQSIESGQTINICAQIGSVSGDAGVTISLTGNPCIDNADCNPL